MPDTRTQTTFRIQPDILRQFQHALVDQQKKMTPVLEHLIRNWLKENDPRQEQIASKSTSAIDSAPQVSPTITATNPTETPLVSDENPIEVSLEASPLNPGYTFATFVPGVGNEFAHAAAQAAADNPGKAFNPLFIYAGVGLGKTHLVQAIGNEIAKRNDRSVVTYLSAENFTNQLVNALRFDQMSAFRQNLRKTDVLIMDDVQFFAQKERTQEEFFHTFNAVYEHGHQIILASDRLPKDLGEIDERLRTRFEWGLIADIQPPDLETRAAILQKKAEGHKVQLPTDVMLFIASNVRTNIRELEGALVRVVAMASLYNHPITLPFAEQALSAVIRDERRGVSIESIQSAIATQFGLKIHELTSENSSRAIVFPRQIAMYLAKSLTDASTSKIGQLFGGKHESTVLHSINKIENLRKEDRDLNRLLNLVRQQLVG